MRGALKILQTSALVLLLCVGCGDTTQPMSSVGDPIKPGAGDRDGDAADGDDRADEPVGDGDATPDDDAGAFAPDASDHTPPDKPEDDRPVSSAGPDDIFGMSIAR